MKKVLILTTSTGQGHNQAANSLIEALTDAGFECVKHDFLASDNKFINKIVVWSYEFFAAKIPHIYGFFYKLTDNKYINNLSSIFFSSVRWKISKFIENEKPDLIIGTHPFTVNIITKLKVKGMSIPFIAVVTDFKAHYTYISPLVDAYVTGSKNTKDFLISVGIKPEIIYPIGIPIKESFFEKDINIPSIKDDEYFSLLLMSGSMGLTSISYVLDELLKNEHKLRITVVCGNNENLRKSLLKKCENGYPNKKIHIFGFSNDIASFMEYSDIIISKPGGLTVTEAIIKNLPLIIPFVIPGQEKDNADFLASNGYAYYVHDIKSINSIVDKIIENPELLSEMKKNLKDLSSTYSSKAIIDISNNLINTNGK
ncbi:glycosyltransferase [Clostridium sp. HBUAS56017]|uniref:MGDG synthase family glycosyltransferase n=1 Tax=Clostridium sp. HBUAS56017 TaxID=2571128 RepID=UPI0011781933|nr:glycosyltransferase [Clostridium sp. HBUAS56017]